MRAPGLARLTAPVKLPSSRGRCSVLPQRPEDPQMLIPDFQAIPFRPVSSPDPAPTEPWLTPEGIAVKSFYGPDDLQGLAYLETWPGLPPYLRGPYPTMYVNQPWTVR